MNMLDDFSIDAFLSVTNKSETQQPCFGEVTGITASGLQIRVDGDEEPGTKEYHRLASYMPTIGDRVFFARVSGSYVILGKVE